ncbi:MAG: gfo/Idh/MocA family oxidoreductase [Acidobacteria bacterium]|nr:gfo/Idh/MocA family oxidoreductase [Acidobacteriota bacterium]
MESKIGWGLIGCGDISRKRVAPALGELDGCELIAVNRGRPELAPGFAQEFGARRWYADWRDLLTDREVEAVYLATPVDLHADQTIAAAEAGKHVLCEKPMAINGAECDRMIDACEANGVKLGIAYYRHFYPVIQRIKELLLLGDIGQPVLARINAFEMFNPPPGSDRYWLLEPARSGGGPMMDFGCHRIEVLINLLGPVLGADSLHSSARLERQVEDTSLASFRFASGAVATLAVSHAAWEPQDTLDIFGERGSFHVPVLNSGQLTIRTKDGDRVEHHPPHSNIHLPLIEDFVISLRACRPPKVDGHQGREVARVEDLIYARGMLTS